MIHLLDEERGFDLYRVGDYFTYACYTGHYRTIYAAEKHYYGTQEILKRRPIDWFDYKENWTEKLARSPFIEIRKLTALNGKYCEILKDDEEPLVRLAVARSNHYREEIFEKETDIRVLNYLRKFKRFNRI